MLRKSPYIALLLLAPLGLLWGQPPAGRILPETRINDCDFCLAAQGISPVEVGSSGLRVDLRYLHNGTLYLNGSKVENDARELETHLTQQYSLFLALSPRTSLAVLVPVAKRYSEELSDDGSVVTGNQFGLGDLSLLVRYKPLVSHTMEATTIVSLSAGLKLPTGRTDGRDSRGNLLDAHVQLGTGSADALVGAGGVIAWERAALLVNALAALTSRGTNGHQFGNLLNYDLTLRYRVYPEDYSGTLFFAALGVNGEWRGREKQDGIPDDNSGGNVTYITPGLQVFFSPYLSFEAAYQYPLLHALRGQQLGEDYRILTGFQLLF